MMAARCATYTSRRGLRLPGRTLLFALLVAACGGSPAIAPTTKPTFDLAAVKVSFTEMCKDPFPPDVDLCEQVQIGAMTADGLILTVPTKLAAADKDRAEQICTRVVIQQSFGSAADLGYEIIGILDAAGGNLYACTVPAAG